MINYIIKRVIMMIPILFGISILSFAIMYAAPGKPAILNLDPEIPPEVREAQAERLGLNDPIPVQYVRWVKNVSKGDFGTSYARKMPVTDMILDRLPNTILLMASSLFLAAIIAIPFGVISATRQYSLTDYGVTVGSFLGLATPNFWLGIMLIMVFSVQLGWTPVGGISTIGADFSLLDRLRHLILPALVLATADMAGLTRYTRSSMLEVINQDYIRTARAKGFRERRVVYKHGLRNGLIPVITMFGLMLPTMIGGSAIVESVFNWPGIGKLFIDATFQRDYPVIMAITMFGALLTVVGNLIADILYAVLDPRIEY
ncbi:ABC transporter permease [Halalkalibacter akibai]|uniref:Oligopeptide transport system permease protein OppB n=1 Tax=Halalkalibacter akibai (strain ATCC 43226 / DSM 21942 / CIP 109018 / JCM 9157 / 1139) TaxID=1236973 RepID=W4QUR5_HALA3|nr:ABC transporter permease [Halalkalibacter akibai]GAE35821.1 oligopeptide transport system permease protein OppB [Halalkalibacter akibai JCM 9157]